MDFWKKIVGYTFEGEYFWTGKGYGIDLAADASSKPNEEAEVRSPHNVFMTILARSGVPGLILWLLFLASFGLELLRRYRYLASGRSMDSWGARCALWLLAYWLAFLLNGSFDVYLEGPMGGVLFWSIVGISLVYFHERRDYSESQRANGKTAPNL